MQIAERLDMKNVLVYSRRLTAREELSELFQSKGYSPFFVDEPQELLSLMNLKKAVKIFLFVQNLSDIRMLNTIRSLCVGAEINLIIPPHLQEIIELLKNNNFKILNEVTQIV
jgi:CheY-like chemotaxis protein